MNNRQEKENAKGELNACYEPDSTLDDLAYRVIGSAIEVHKHLGPGFLENVYEEALAVEFKLRGVPFQRQVAVTASYKGVEVGEGKIDFVVGNSLVVEIKAVSRILPVHTAQVISYLKAFGSPLGLLLNFKEFRLQSGIKRLVLGKQREDS